MSVGIKRCLLRSVIVLVCIFMCMVW